MQKRHAHVSPTLDIMAKKIFSLPEVTTAFIRDILELDVADAQIVEGSQPHSMAYEEDDLFSTAVDVRAKLHDGTEVIIEIQIRKQQYFLNRFHYYLANQLVENVQKLRQQGQTHKMYEQMEPVYGIAILEKSLLLDEEGAINKYWLINSRSGKQLKAYYKNGKHQNLLQVAFLELDKYNKDENLTDAGRQWLEFFGNLPFTKAPSQAVAHADSLLDSSSWTKEEKTMIDERIRIQENYDMTLETAIDEAREEGLEQGRKQLVCKMVSRGMTPELISDMTGLSLEEIESLLS
ncbi:Rpn family recombination-promoting nuclease/putative transposase [Streptococcus parasanguinis]|uniref:Rpn family recombination-promoting nuclease/putative transposase n=1 Tax=Streptococcus parasanguinis TaxID=1318 RepID=UPI0039C33C63